MLVRTLCLGVVGLIFMVLGGCRARQPNGLEALTIQWAKHHVTIGGKDQRNPVTPPAEHIEAGKRAFGDYCVACHGRDGQNTGVPFAGSMSPPIPSLASPSVQRYTDGQLKWIIDNGIFPSGMPASKGTLSDEEM